MLKIILKIWLFTLCYDALASESPFKKGRTGGWESEEEEDSSGESEVCSSLSGNQSPFSPGISVLLGKVHFSPSAWVSPEAREDLFERGGEPANPSKRCLFSLAEPRQGTKVLFLGVHTGIPERQFLDQYFHGQYEPREVELTSYQGWLHDHSNAGNAHVSEACAKCQCLDAGYFVDEEGVDATLLDSAAYANRGMTSWKYEAIVWIGPTLDDGVESTHQLVRRFVDASFPLLKEGGKVIVVQAMSSPLFREIIALDGAKNGGNVQLSGRETHFGKHLEQRVDDVIVFTRPWG